MSTLTNDYVMGLNPGIFDKCPKAVFAAMAISALTSGGENIEIASNAVLDEWWCLFACGIVPQKPPLPRPEEGWDEIVS